ncbi:MAG: NmrA family NAD(P)-binding protein [Deltaproteobacteria bacterium]|jgi:uncharacterized protein YbjT (DUF2867 family)|nr:NmrA family NAD(P)-binding protein [Deltaproteobacteria bacterium]
MAMERYLITGGTGRIGTAFVHEMAARGHAVRLGTRSPDGAGAQLRARFGPGLVEPVALPEDEPAALDAAFAGCTGALLVAPFGEMAKWHGVMADAAKRAGLAHIVKVSVTGARAPDSDPPPGLIPSMHWEGEEIVRATGIPWTVIRPTIFAQHFLGLSPTLFQRGDRHFHLPTGDAAVAWLDCRDIAACAAAILSSPARREAFAGRAFELTGPTSVTAAEIEQILSGVAGRPISHVDGMEAFSSHAADLSVPDTIKGIYGEAAGGWFSEVHDGEFVEATGRHSTSFAKFAFDHQAWFAAIDSDS